MLLNMEFDPCCYLLGCSEMTKLAYAFMQRIASSYIINCKSSSGTAEQERYPNPQGDTYLPTTMSSGICGGSYDCFYIFTTECLERQSSDLKQHSWIQRIKTCHLHRGQLGTNSVDLIHF